MSSSPRSHAARDKNLRFKKYYYDYRAQLEKLGMTAKESRKYGTILAKRRLNRRYKK